MTDTPALDRQPLRRWNDALASRHCYRVYGTLIGIIATALLAGHAIATGRIGSPPVYPDALDYVAIARGIAGGHGFAADYSASGGGTPDQTALRPPLLPGVLAACEWIAPGDFTLPHLLIIASVGATAGIVASVTARLLGPLPALTLVPIAMLAADWRVREMSRSLLTEGPAMLLVSWSVMTAAKLARRPATHRAIGLGVLLGLLVLMRTVVALWFPVVAIGLVLTLRRASVPRPFLMTAVTMGVSFVVCLPWLVRNVRVTGGSYPLGTQGAVELPTGFSDAAWAAGGVWNAANREAQLIGHGSPPGIADEVATANRNRRLAVDWVKAHPVRTVLLGLRKMYAEFGGHSVGKWCFWMLAVVGAIGLRGEPEVPLVATLVVACFLSVAVTWSVSGRFVWPLLPLLHLLAAAGLWTALLAAVDARLPITKPS